MQLPFNESFNRAFFEARDKAGVYKENFYLRDHLQLPIVAPKLKSKAVRDQIIAYTGQMLDERSSVLADPAPMKKFHYGEKDIEPLMKLFGVTKEQLWAMFQEVNKEAYYGRIPLDYVGWVKNAPWKLLFIAILIDALQNGYKEIVECIEWLYALNEYPIIFSNSWKTGVNPELMKYTIEHMSNQNTIKKVGNVKNLLKYDMDVSLEAHKDRLILGADHDYMDAIARFRNQIKNKFVIIARAYYKNHGDDLTMHQQDSMFDDGNINPLEGLAATMTHYIDKAMRGFAPKNINVGIARGLAQSAHVDAGKLEEFLRIILDAEDNQLREFIECVITAYFSNNQSDTKLGGKKFITFGLTMYRSMGTSKQPLFLKLRQILDLWMFDILKIQDIFKTRKATIIGYTRAIFNYMIFMINSYCS